MEKNIINASDVTDFADKLLAVILGHSEVKDVLALCSSATGVGCAFFDLENGKVCINSMMDEFAEQCTFYPLAEVLRIYKHWTVTSDGVKGYLVTDGAYTKTARFEVLVPLIIRALLICKMHKQNIESDANSGNSLLKRLLEAPPSEFPMLHEQLKTKKFDYRRGFFVMITHIGTHNRDCCLSPVLCAELFKRHENILKGTSIKFLRESLGNSFLTAVFCKDPEKTNFLLKNAQAVSKHFLQTIDDTRHILIVTGVGGYGYDLPDFLLSRRQAEAAIRNAILNRLDITIAHWNDIGIEQILTGAFPDNMLRSGMYLALEEICLLQKVKKAPFFSTLIALVRNYWNMTATAKELALHYNSMKYRYDNICRLMNVDMNSEQIRFELSIALRTYLYNMPFADFWDMMVF